MKRARALTLFTLIAVFLGVSFSSHLTESSRAGKDLAALEPLCTPSTALRISEFRLRGAAGPNDEFIEFYNNSDSQLTVCTADGSSGWALAARNASASSASTVFVIPNGTTIPARGHLLAVNNGPNGYSLSNYPSGSGATATGDISYATDIEDNSGIALFVTSNPANFSTANRSDAAGFSGPIGTIAELYREGSGLPTLVGLSIDYAWVRDTCGKGGSITTFGNCPISTPKDTNNNAADFYFVDTNGNSVGGGQRLGAPGPENLYSPIKRNSSFTDSLLDPCVGSASAPNRVRNFTSDPANNSTFGTLDIRRTITNNTGAAVTRLRFRIIDLTTFPAPSGIADLRPRTSTSVEVTVDRVPCGSGTSNVTVKGTTLEQPPSQPNGGGFNSSLSAGTITLATPLPPTDDPNTVGVIDNQIDLSFLLGVQQTGSFKFMVNVEALTDPATDPATGSASARIDPMNQTGSGAEDPLSRNSGWSVPIVSLPGRAGLDLGLSLAYNSLATWTKKGSSIFFNDDHGFPAPGFRLGFPVIQSAFFNSQADKNAFLLITPDGRRVELRQVGVGSLYQSVDSSYLLLDADTMTLRAPDGTQLSYAWTESGDYVCTQIKDRNGNFIGVNYDTSGRIDTIVDTLARTIKFNYTGGDLSSITQTWSVNGQQQPTYTWATFSYANQTIQTNFTGLTVEGPQNGSTIRALTRVTFPDNSHHDFDYTSWGQVWKVRQYAPGDHLLNYRSYNLPLDSSTPQTDCPRYTERRDWAKNWNRNQSGVEQEAVTYFTAPTPVTIPGTSLTGTVVQITAPDGTSQKMYYGSAATTPGWQNGIVLLAETYDSSSVKQRWVYPTWTQDDPSVSYKLNPRVTETNVHDYSNRARTRVDYANFNLPNGTTVRLPQDVYEYAADAATVLRRTRTEYKMQAPYTDNDKRILGLPSTKYLCDGTGGEVPCTGGASLLSKVTYEYDETESIQGTDAPVQHANPVDLIGRGNVSSIRRHDVTNVDGPTMTTVQYNRAGSVVKTIDAEGHATEIFYVDAFAANGMNLDTGLPATFAYPTTVKDPGGFTASTRYNYQFGAPTWKQTPLPNETNNQPGPQQVIAYDSIGRLMRVTSHVNGAYTRYNYGPNYLETFVSVNPDYVQPGNNVADEAHSLQVFDGHGRVIGKANNHPSAGANRFSGQLIIYDQMGRAIKQSNPTETSITITGTSPINPANWPVMGDDAPGNVGVSPAPGYQPGWYVTTQTYDWKGRPLVTTNQDGTTKIASYEGCGCAGGEMVTLQDEGTIINSELKRRTQRIFSDVLGRKWKTEVLNWDGAVYSSSVNVFNARDQVKLINQYAGAAPIDASSTNESVACVGSCQKTTMSFDGYGRLESKHVPEQKVDPNNPASTDHTTWTYNLDDTVQSVKDARGVTTSFGYNSRHLVTSITYPEAQNLPPGVSPTSDVSYVYDAAGNRTSMTDGSGSTAYQYNLLSQMTSETRSFAGFTGSFTLAYEYALSGAVRSVTDQHAGTSFTTSFHSSGQVSGVSTIGYGGGFTQYASNMQYRASGAAESVGFGNNTSVGFGYNNRLQLTSYSLTGVSYIGSIPLPVSSTYQYYSDGNLKFTQNQATGNSTPHRAYQYDHAARLQEAFSGSEAQDFINNTSTAPATGPYRQSFTYDAWSNSLTSGGRFWSRTEIVTATFDESNRNPDWSYDAEGNVTSRNETFSSGSSPGYGYDAAGLKTSTSQVRSCMLEPQHELRLRLYTNTNLYDGDGRMTRYRREDRPNPIQPPDSVLDTYYLRSTVLGGRVISEYNQTDWNGTYVYAGGQRIGMLSKVGAGTPRNYWRANDPVTGDEISTTDNGMLTDQTSFDSQGVEVGFQDPFPPPGEESGECVEYDPGYRPNEPVAAGLIPDGSSAKCIVDGIQADCQSMGSQTMVQCPDNDCGPRVRNDGTHTQQFQAFADGYSGFLPQGAKYEGYGRWVIPGERPNTPPSLGPGRPRPDDGSGRDEGAFTGNLAATRTFQFTISLGLPQKTLPYVDKTVLAECIKTQFGVDLRSFQESRVGTNGSFTGYGPDSGFTGTNPNGPFEYDSPNPGSDREFTVINEVNAYNGKQLADFYKKSSGNNPLGIVLGYFGSTSSGFTSYRNFTNKTVTNAMTLITVQVHELGNSLSHITTAKNNPNIKVTNPGYSPDPDAGAKLQKCVREKKGFKY